MARWPSQKPPTSITTIQGLHGNYPIILKSASKKHANNDMRSCKCVSAAVPSWSGRDPGFTRLVKQLIDLFVGSDALSVNHVCPCQAPATGKIVHLLCFRSIDSVNTLSKFWIRCNTKSCLWGDVNDPMLQLHVKSSGALHP